VSLSGVKGKRVGKTNTTEELDVRKLTGHMKIVHFLFLEQGRTSNQHCYLEILARLREAVVGEDLNFGLMLGSCIMTMPKLMTRSLSGSVWPKIDIEIVPSSIFARFCPVRFLAIPKTEDRFEGPQIFRHCRHSGTCDDHHAEYSRRRVPEMF
jgi:hypothetical protein